MRAPGARQLLTSLLRDVSRSFYLTLRVLPGSSRAPIGRAYRLARTTDPVAATGLVPVEGRLAALKELRDRIEGRTDRLINFGELAQHQGSPAERVLLEKAELSLALLRRLSPADQQLVRGVLEIICTGQELDLRRFGSASAGQVVALKTEAELDDYTYRVAGCVGEFWTKMCRAHLFPQLPLDEAGLLANGIRFGKGLQLVNVLRDLPADLRQGRCYLPSEQLAKEELVPTDLLDSKNEPRLRPVYDPWLGRAEAHLAAGWLYTNTLPRRCVRVRLACAWPLLIGRQTLGLLRSGGVLDAQKRCKVPRAQVRRILCRSVLYYPWSQAWNRLYPRA